MNTPALCADPRLDVALEFDMAGFAREQRLREAAVGFGQVGELLGRRERVAAGSAARLDRQACVQRRRGRYDAGRVAARARMSRTPASAAAAASSTSAKACRRCASQARGLYRRDCRCGRSVAGRRAGEDRGGGQRVPFLGGRVRTCNERYTRRRCTLACTRTHVARRASHRRNAWLSRAFCAFLGLRRALWEKMCNWGCIVGESGVTSRQRAVVEELLPLLHRGSIYLIGASTWPSAAPLTTRSTRRTA